MVYQHMSSNTGDTHPDTYAAAKEHLAKGRLPVPIPYGTKAPKIKDWQTTPFTEEHFRDYPNIGLKLDHHIVEVDCDCPYIIALAPHLLPKTAMVHGRPSKPLSHYWYAIDGDGEHETYTDARGADGKYLVLVELRGGSGRQTVIPPSTYQLNGSAPEQLAWKDGQEGTPALVELEELQQIVRKMATIVLLSLHWGGARHNIALALVGYLVRGGMEDDGIYEIVKWVCWLTKDEEADDRKQAARDTIEKYHNGEAVTGGKTLRALLGKEVVGKIENWLHLKPVLEEDATNAADLYKYEGNDVGNAEAVRALHGDRLRFTAAMGWLTHTETHWMPDSTEIVDQAIIDTFRKRRAQASARELDVVQKKCWLSNANIVACRSRLQALSGIKVGIAEFDNVPYLLNTASGVVDVRSGALVSHDPSDRFTYCLSSEIGTEEDANPFIGYIRDAVNGNEAMVAYIRQAIGYSFTGYTREEILFYLYGPTRGGKGTFAEALLAALEGPLARGAEFKTFTAKREGGDQGFDFAELRSARFVVASESNQHENLNSGKVKQATGGDLITCAKKHHQPFSYRPQFKIWLLSNWPCNGDPEDDALWARIRVINFPNSHLGVEDKELKERMKSEQVQRGILWLGIKGAGEWFSSSGGLLTPQGVQTITQEHRSMRDYVQQWIDEHGVELRPDDPDAWESSGDVVRDYTLWCGRNNVEPKGPKALAQSLKHKGCTPSVQKRDTQGNMLRGFQGIRLREKHIASRSSAITLINKKA